MSICRSYGGYLVVDNTLPIKGIHENYNLFIDYIKNNDLKYKTFFNKDKCFAILKSGENKGKQCSSKHKKNSCFCGKHTSIL